MSPWCVSVHKNQWSRRLTHIICQHSILMNRLGLRQLGGSQSKFCYTDVYLSTSQNQNSTCLHSMYTHSDWVHWLGSNIVKELTEQNVDSGCCHILTSSVCQDKAFLSFVELNASCYLLLMLRHHV